MHKIIFLVCVQAHKTRLIIKMCAETRINMKKRTACITGASSGIGYEMAKKLSALGYDLILVARNTKALKKLAASLDTDCEIYTCDLSDGKSCIKLGRKLSKRSDIHIFINNAGFGDIGDFEKTSMGGVYLSKEGKKVFLRMYEEKLNSKIIVKGERMTYRRLLENEVQSYKNYLLNGEKYNPYKYY